MPKESKRHKWQFDPKEREIAKNSLDLISIARRLFIPNHKHPVYPVIYIRKT